MRPTVTEQLAGISRILDSVIRPEVGSEYGQQILTGVIENLRVVAASQGRIEEFLVWDNAGMAKILTHEGTPPATSQPPEPDTVQRLTARNVELRQRLSELIADLGAGHELLAPIVEHLAERATRYPLRFVPPMPNRPQSPEQ